MNIWQILGIEETTDLSKIKEAYVEKLQIFHPEEDPEGFQKLRAAYEEALKQNKDPEEITEFTMLLDDVKEIYFDFSKRINKEQWEILLETPICCQIDTEKEALETMLAFFSSNYFLPNYIWVLLIEHFSIDEREEELCGMFPEDFIKFILNWRTYKDLIRYDKFIIEPDKNYDEFISMCQDINQNFMNYNEEEMDKQFKKLDDFGIFNLDSELFRCRHYNYANRNDMALVLATKLLEDYPDDTKVLHALGQINISTENFDEANKCFERILKIDPENEHALYGHADCYYGKEDYIIAKDLYYKIIAINYYDRYVGERYFLVNEKLTPYYLNILENDEPYFEEDKELTKNAIKMKLASCYFNTHLYQECNDLLNGFSPDKEHDKEYFSILADTYSILENPEKVLETIELWKETDENNERIYSQEASALFKLDRNEESFAVCEKGIELFPNASGLYNTMGQIYSQKGEHQNAVDICKKGVELCVNSLPLYVTLSEEQYKIGNFADSLENCARAVEIYPYIPEVYFVKAKIFLEVKDYDEVLRICEAFEIFQREDLEIEYFKATALRNKNEEIKAIEILKKLLEQKPSVGKYYYDLALNYESIDELDEAVVNIKEFIKLEPDHNIAKMILVRFYRHMKKFKEAHEICDKVLKEFPNSDFVFVERAFLFRDQDKLDKSIESFIKADELDPNSSYILDHLAKIYMQKNEYKLALGCYNKIIVDNSINHPYYFVSRGIAFSRLKMLDEQVADYKRAIELDENYAWAFNNLGYTYYLERDYEQAKYFYEIAIEKDETFFSSYRFLAETYVESNKFDKAFEILDKAIEIFKDEERNSGFLCRKARFHRKLGNFKEAIEACEVALKFDPKSSAIYSTLICTYLDVGEYEKAIEVANEGLKEIVLQEDKYCVYGNIGDVYRTGYKNYKKAIEFYTKSIELDEEFICAYMYRGICYKELKMTKKSEDDLKKAIELAESLIKEEPEDTLIYTIIGRCHLYLKNYEDAMEFALKSIEIAKIDRNCFNAVSNSVFFLMFLIYKEQNKKDLAMEYIDKAIAINPICQYLDERKNCLKLSEEINEGTNVVSKLRKWFNI